MKSSDYTVQYIAERSEYLVERSGVERSGNETKWPDTLFALLVTST